MKVDWDLFAAAAPDKRSLDFRIKQESIFLRPPERVAVDFAFAVAP